MKQVWYLVAFGMGLIGGIVFMLFLFYPKPPSTVQINIHNESGSAVTDIIVTGQKGAVTLNRIESGKAEAVPLLVFGEGTFEIEATLQDGTVLSGHGGYVESGYTVKEIITATGIEHEHISF